MNHSVNSSIEQRGIDVLANSRVAICCLVRDCLGALKRNISTLEEIRSYCDESFLVFIENDSVDGTKEFVSSLASQENGVFVNSFETGAVTLPKYLNSRVNPSYSEHRISKMARYRNLYLDELESNIGLSNLDWVIIIDPDVKSISFKGILNSFGQSDNWDVVHANGRMKYGFRDDRYFDTYAFKADDDYSDQTEKEIANNQHVLKSLKVRSPMLPVRSGFNGLAIYRAESLKGTSYQVVKNNDSRVEVLCEHVALHDVIRKNGFKRQFCNPSMIVNYNTRGHAIWRFFRSLAAKYLKGLKKV